MSGPLRILVPMDGSPPALSALRHVLDLAGRGLLVEIHLLNVQLPVRGAAAALIAKAELEAYHRDEGMKCLEVATDLLKAAGHRPFPHVGVGAPGETVVAFIARLHCDLVAMGTRGFGGVGGMLLGSVASHVVANAAVPVTLLRGN